MHKKKLSRKNSKSHTTNKPRLNYLEKGAVEKVENKRFNRRGPRRKTADLSADRQGTAEFLGLTI